jgi:hypothetical protein
MKKTLATLAILGASCLIASADPISVAPVVTDATAQVELTVTEVLPYVAAGILGLIALRWLKRLVK